MCVPNIYVVGFETITQIMLTVVYNTLIESNIRTKKIKKVLFTHHVIYFSHKVKIHVPDTNIEIVYIFFIIKPKLLSNDFIRYKTIVGRTKCTSCSSIPKSHKEFHEHHNLYQERSYS
jgi:hypothetical protein